MLTTESRCDAMAIVHESIVGLEFLIATLAGDSTLATYAPGGVFRVLAPPSTPPPYVIVASHSGADVLTINAVRMMSDLLYQVRVIGPSSMMSQIAGAAQEIDNLLGRTSGSANGGIVLACFRESPIQSDEELEGEMWVTLGGLYRLYVQQTS